MRALGLTALALGACDFDAAYRQFKLNADIIDASFMCPRSVDPNPCFKCQNENCCREYDRCHADARCTEYFTACLPQCDADGGT